MSTNTHTLAVVGSLRQLPTEVESALSGELDAMGRLIERRLKMTAPKWRTALTQSVHMSSPEPLVREVSPGAAYASAVEEGVRPGGKGLPRFFDPASRSIVQWLQGKAFGSARKPRKGSLKFTAMELELRDRYEGLAWSVRHKGTKARPFVKPAFQQLEPTMRVRLITAVEAAMRASAAQGGTA
ncbi:hypothetical protein [Variovorax sp. HJSM1_2]|uniref:hypothetical protein n=1 Tax=Variovorax sp. HJSM1_2 TaxID=3366263 RepID=UPI003BDD6F4D